MKAYSKPEIVFEDFSLSTNIAAGCELTSNWGRDACAVEIPVDGMVINAFLDSMSICVYKVDENNDGMCYNVPVGGNNAFIS